MIRFTYKGHKYIWHPMQTLAVVLAAVIAAGAVWLIVKGLIAYGEYCDKLADEALKAAEAHFNF